MKEAVIEENQNNLWNLYAIYSTSCMGHDYTPVCYNPTCAHEADYVHQLINGSMNATIYFENCTLQGLDVIWTAHEGITFGGLGPEQVPINLRTIDTCCYGPKLQRIQ